MINIKSRNINGSGGGTRFCFFYIMLAAGDLGDRCIIQIVLCCVVQQVMSFMGQVELILCTYPSYPVLNITSNQSSLNLYTGDVDHQ
jgi:hypothetical protein